MSRSRRKTPVVPFTNAETDKPYKQQEHRRSRRNTHQVLNESWDGDDPRLFEENYGDPWSSMKDGRTYIPKDDEWYEKALRK